MRVRLKFPDRRESFKALRMGLLVMIFDWSWSRYTNDFEYQQRVVASVRKVFMKFSLQINKLKRIISKRWVRSSDGEWAGCQNAEERDFGW